MKGSLFSANGLCKRFGGVQAVDNVDLTIEQGQVIGLIDDIPRCADLIERMVADCRAALARAQNWALPP